MNSSLTIVPRFLRSPDAFFENIKQGQDLDATSRSLAVSAILFLASYGFVLGLSHSLWQALSSAVKMPMLFVATLLFCLPAFYAFALVFGTPLRISQFAAVGLTGIGVTAFLLLSLSPVTLFFVLTSRSYPFFQLLAVVFVAISGCVGVYFLWRGMVSIDTGDSRQPPGLRRILLLAWFALYAFVGSQMTWRLSPLVGDPALPFVLVRPSRDNFYMDVLHALEQVSGTPPSAWNAVLPLGWLLFGGICLIPLILAIFSMGMAAGRATPGIRRAAA